MNLLGDHITCYLVLKLHQNYSDLWRKHLELHQKTRFCLRDPAIVQLLTSYAQTDSTAHRTCECSHAQVKWVAFQAYGNEFSVSQVHNSEMIMNGKLIRALCLCHSVSWCHLLRRMKINYVVRHIRRPTLRGRIIAATFHFPSYRGHGCWIPIKYVNIYSFSLNKPHFTMG